LLTHCYNHDAQVSGGGEVGEGMRQRQRCIKEYLRWSIQPGASRDVMEE